MGNELNREEYIVEALAGQKIDLSREQARKLCDYYDLLIERNTVMNLTRITGFQDAVERHFVDSMILARYVDFSGVKRVLDLGSGAGFPGIPLKILFPHISLCLIDSVGKKMQFVGDAAEALGLRDVETLHVRAEDLAGKNGYRENFDLCVSRAVANMRTLSEYCLPFVRTGGLFAAYKSAEAGAEIREAEPAIRKLGGKLLSIESFSLYDMGRSIALVSKERHTPPAYPRKAGTASRNPL